MHLTGFVRLVTSDTIILSQPKWQSADILKQKICTQLTKHNAACHPITLNNYNNVLF